jgi:hypothetical protein
MRAGRGQEGRLAQGRRRRGRRMREGAAQQTQEPAWPSAGSTRAAAPPAQGARAAPALCPRAPRLAQHVERVRQQRVGRVPAGQRGVAHDSVRVARGVQLVERGVLVQQRVEAVVCGGWCVVVVCVVVRQQGVEAGASSAGLLGAGAAGPAWQREPASKLAAPQPLTELVQQRTDLQRGGAGGDDCEADYVRHQHRHQRVLHGREPLALGSKAGGRRRGT